MRLLLLLIQLSVFVPMLHGIDRLLHWLLGPLRWPGMPMVWMLAIGGALALLVSVLTELDLRKQARRDAVRAGSLHRM